MTTKKKEQYYLHSPTIDSSVYFFFVPITHNGYCMSSSRYKAQKYRIIS